MRSLLRVLLVIVCIVVMIVGVIVRMIMTVRMAVIVRVIVMRMRCGVAVSMFMMRVLMVRVIVIAADGMRVMGLFDTVIVFRHDRRRRFGSGGTQRTKKSAPLYPEQANADEHDQRIADSLDDMDGVAHRFGGGADQHRGHADDQHSSHGLQQRRGE